MVCSFNVSSATAKIDRKFLPAFHNKAGTLASPEGIPRLSVNNIFARLAGVRQIAKPSLPVFKKTISGDKIPFGFKKLRCFFSFTVNAFAKLFASFILKGWPLMGQP